MRTLIYRTFVGALSISLLLVSFAVGVSAQKKTRLQDAERHSREAAKVFTQIMNVRDKAIPRNYWTRLKRLRFSRMS